MDNPSIFELSSCLSSSPTPAGQANSPPPATCRTTTACRSHVHGRHHDDPAPPTSRPQRTGTMLQAPSRRCVAWRACDHDAEAEAARSAMIRPRPRDRSHTHTHARTRNARRRSQRVAQATAAGNATQSTTWRRHVPDNSAGYHNTTPKQAALMDNSTLSTTECSLSTTQQTPVCTQQRTRQRHTEPKENQQPQANQTSLWQAWSP